jgi:DNA-binding IclR family transcriptional regulator
MGQSQGTVERVIALLTHIALSSGPIRVSDVADALDLPQSTVHRLIGQFIALGLLRRTAGSRHYEAGSEAFRIGAALLQRINIVELAMPCLHTIVQAAGESCALGLYRETDATLFFAAQVQSPQPIRYTAELFKAESVLWGVSGRAVLAHLPARMVRVLLEGDPVSPTGKSPPKLRTLEEQLAQIRERGYATSQRGEKTANASGIAVPVFAAGGRIVGCMALSAPSDRYDKSKEGRLAQVMMAEARMLSAELRTH